MRRVGDRELDTRVRRTKAADDPGQRLHGPQRVGDDRQVSESRLGDRADGAARQLE